MKKFKLVLVAMFAATALMAQDYVYLYHNNGKVDEVAISDFDSLSFTKPKPATTGEAERKDGEGTVKVKWVQLWENGPKFAEYNVGATAVGEYGGYYAWGGSQDKVDDHNTGTDPLSGDSDTATKLWGSNWRMPSDAEFQALLANCTVAWKSKDESGYGVAGRLYTGKDDYAGNSVFFPAAGYYYSGQVRLAGSRGSYWSSAPSGSNVAYSLSFGPDDQNVSSSNRFGGYSVRAILK